MSAQIKKYSKNVRDNIDAMFNDYINNIDVSQIDLAQKYGISTWAVSTNLRLYAKNTGQEDVYENATKLHFLQARENKENTGIARKSKKENKSINKAKTKTNVSTHSKTVPASSTTVISDVQDLGDVLVVTTTTTVICKK